ncbi:MAG: hypothetical protein JW874_06920, partial [Spirochaetales bacterium]|nr:hypothetical protein [Spirochaetales bacterium]
ILVLFVSAVQAQTTAQLDRVFNFDFDLKDIVESLPAAMETLRNKFFVIHGSVDNIEILDKNPETFTARITLLFGKWEGFSDLETYMAVMFFRGPHFAEIIPVRPPRQVTPELIVINKNLTILCQLTGLEEKDGQKIPVFEVYKVKN